jgi:hypothetical protein
MAAGNEFLRKSAISRPILTRKMQRENTTFILVATVNVINRKLCIIAGRYEIWTSTGFQFDWLTLNQ